MLVEHVGEGGATKNVDRLPEVWDAIRDWLNVGALEGTASAPPLETPRLACKKTAPSDSPRRCSILTTMPQAAERPPTLLESALRCERISAVVLLVIVLVFSWIWIVAMARDMYGPMTGASAWMMTLHWDVPHLLLLWAMWAVMMTGMMLPSASPLILLYGAAARRSAQPTAARQTYALAAGYLLAWTAFSLGATVLQRVLVSLLLLSPMMEPVSSRVTATLLLAAGVYQWTPLKHACLRQCQSPIGFLMGRWRSGSAGALLMGLEHGTFCVGCCWALMLLLFAGGVMNLLIIVGLTAFVAFEKLVPLGHGARLTGGLLVAMGVWRLLQ
jgi:predicted metal-binding membrane protein